MPVIIYGHCLYSPLREPPPDYSRGGSIIARDSFVGPDRNAHYRCHFFPVGHRTGLEFVATALNNLTASTQMRSELLLEVVGLGARSTHDAGHRAHWRDNPPSEI